MFKPLPISIMHRISVIVIEMSLLYTVSSYDLRRLSNDEVLVTVSSSQSSTINQRSTTEWVIFSHSLSRCFWSACANKPFVTLMQKHSDSGNVKMRKIHDMTIRSVPQQLQDPESSSTFAHIQYISKYNIVIIWEDKRLSYRWGTARQRHIKLGVRQMNRL